MRIKIKQGPVTLNFHLTVILWRLTQLILTEGQSCEEALSHGRGTSEKSVIAETHTTVTTDECQSAWCVHDTVASVFSEKSGNFLQFILKLEKLKNQLWPTAGSQFQKHPQMAWYNKSLALICMSEENFMHGTSWKFSQNFLWIDLQFINRAPSKSDITD